MHTVRLAQSLQVRLIGGTGQCACWRWICLPIIVLLAPPALPAVPVEESVAENAPAQQAQPIQAPAEPPTDASASVSEVQVYGISQQGPAAVPANQPGPASGAGTDAARLHTLFRQMQVLQQELRTLRGLVEEQAFQIGRLARDQQEQYVDLDGRILALGRGAGSPTADAPYGGGPGASPGPLAQPLAPASGGARQQPSPGPGASTASSEQEAYTQAFNLMRARQLEAAATGFRQTLENYPNGQFAPNCYYWLGELHLFAGEYEQARQQFTQVVNLYDDHNKVPDALYKLGVLHQRLGDNERALEHLQRVQKEYPDSSAAGLAQSLAAELQ